jgi:probable rRNA maturation factor
VLEVEVIGAVPAIAPAEVERLAGLACASAGIDEGHLAVTFVSSDQIRVLNKQHRGKDSATDVLSFPVDGVDEGFGSDRELGDVVVSPQDTVDLREAVLHGVLHLVGMDHEVDDGEMLALQRELLSW